MKKGKKYGIVILGISILLIGLLFLLWKNFENAEKSFLPAYAAGNSYSAGWVKYPHAEYLEFWKAIDQKEAEDYNCLLLTSYRCCLFDIEDVSWGFGVSPIQAVSKDGSIHEMRTVLETTFQKTDDVSTVFLELDPRQHNDDGLVKWIQAQPKTDFLIFFTPYPADYWKKLEEHGKLEERLIEYKELAGKLGALDNVMLFYFDNQEWMVQNPWFFQNGTRLSEDAVFQMFSAFGCGNCRITEAELEDKDTVKQENEDDKKLSEKKAELIPAMAQREYQDFSGQTIFCFGDSMLAKDRDESGIAETAAGLLNAEVYNAAVNGSSASGTEPRDLSNMLDLLLDWEQEKDRLKTSEYQEQIPLEAAEALIGMQEVTPDYIILAYGYNDYSAQAFPYAGGRNGQASFKDSLRENIRRLKEAYPEAKIIVSTAVTSGTDLGGNYPLEWYARAAREAAEAEGVYCLYNYNTEELTFENLEWLLSDGVHFSVTGRFVQAGRIAEFLESIAQ